jgi:hypothetical protein
MTGRDTTPYLSSRESGKGGPRQAQGRARGSFDEIVRRALAERLWGHETMTLVLTVVSDPAGEGFVRGPAGAAQRSAVGGGRALTHPGLAYEPADPDAAEPAHAGRA